MEYLNKEAVPNMYFALLNDKTKRFLAFVGTIVLILVGFGVEPVLAAEAFGEFSLNATEALPAWRWAGGTSSIYTNFGIGDQFSGASIISFLASIFFGISSFIWTITLAMSTLGANAGYSPTMANLINKGWAASYDATLGSGLIGVVLFAIFAVMVFRMLASGFRDLGIRQLAAGLVFLAIFVYFGTTAKASVDLVENSPQENPSLNSPGGLTLEVVSFVGRSVGSVTTQLLTADFGTTTGVDPATDALHCQNYEEWLRQAWRDDVSLDGTATNDFSKNYLQLISDTWSASQYQMWKYAQFGFDNGYGNKTGCWFLESREGSPGLAITYLREEIGDFEGIDGSVGNDVNADLICVINPASFLFSDCTPASDSGLLTVNVWEGEGEILIHGREQVFRRNMIGFAACSYVDGNFVVAEEWQSLSNGKRTTPEACAEWIETGETNDIAGISPWDYSSRDSILEATRATPGARDYILSLNGHNGAAIVLAAMSITIAIFIAFFLLRLTLGLLIATLTSVVYGIFAPFMLLAIASNVPLFKSVGEASLRRWMSSFFATIAMTLFIAAVMLTNRVLQLIINSLFDGVGSTAPTAGVPTGLTIEQLLQAILVGVSILASFFIVTGFLKKNNLKAMYTAKGMRDWGQAAFTSAKDQQAWSQHMGIDRESRGRRLVRGLGGDIRENLVEQVGIPAFKRAGSNLLEKRFGANKDELSVEEELKGSRSLKNRTRKPNKEVGEKIKANKGELKELEAELRDLKDIRVDGKDREKHLEDIRNASKKVRDKKRQIEGLQTHGDLYDSLIKERQKIEQEEEKIQKDLSDALAKRDDEAAKSLVEGLANKRAEKEGVRVQMNALEDGIDISGRKAKGVINERMERKMEEVKIETREQLKERLESSVARRDINNQLELFPHNEGEATPQVVFREAVTEHLISTNEEVVVESTETVVEPPRRSRPSANLPPERVVTNRVVSESDASSPAPRPSRPKATPPAQRPRPSDSGPEREQE